MRVLIFSPGQDTAGVGTRIKQAFDAHVPAWDVRAVCATETYIQYPTDLVRDRVGKAAIQELYDAADVIHCGNNLANYWEFDKGQHKPVVVTYHGTEWRQGPALLHAQAQAVNAIELVATIDLLLFFPPHEPGRWQPNPIDVGAMQQIRAARPPAADALTVYHSPTNRKVKDTKLFQAAMDRLRQNYPRVRLQLVEGVSWATNLTRKATADVVYDQLQFGWGMNAIEAWAMGLPVIVDTQFQAVKNLMWNIIGRERMPNYPASTASLYQRLVDMVTDPGMREEYGRRGYEYVRRWHDYPVVANSLKAVYELAHERRPVYA